MFPSPTHLYTVHTTGKPVSRCVEWHVGLNEITQASFDTHVKYIRLITQNCSRYRKKTKHLIHLTLYEATQQRLLKTHHSQCELPACNDYNCCRRGIKSSKSMSYHVCCAQLAALRQRCCWFSLCHRRDESLSCLWRCSVTECWLVSSRRLSQWSGLRLPAAVDSPCVYQCSRLHHTHRHSKQSVSSCIIAIIITNSKF